MGLLILLLVVIIPILNSFSINWKYRKCIQRGLSTSKVDEVDDNILLRLNSPEVYQFNLHGYDFAAYFKDYKLDDKMLQDNASLNEKLIQLIGIENGWGNGLHPTTQLCLNSLHSVVKPGDSVLDYGCGSGILSIWASKCGASKCSGIEVCEDSINAAKKNVLLNKCDNINIHHTREVYIGNEDFQLYDVAVANILPGVLSRLAAPLIGLLKPNGFMILSGIRRSDLKAIREIYSPFILENSEEVSSASHDVFVEWISLTFQTKNLTKIELQNHFQTLLDSNIGY